MSDRRLQWSHSEQQLLLQLRFSYPGFTIPEIRELFNKHIHFERHRTDEAVKSQLARLHRRQPLPPSSTKNASLSISCTHFGKFAFAAPEFGIYVPLHPLHAGDPVFNNYAKYLAEMPDPSKRNLTRG